MPHTAPIVYVPGLPLRGQSPEEARRDIALLVQEANCPVNVLASAALPPGSVLRELGVRRLSVGSSVMRLAYASGRDTAAQILTTGAFDALALADTLAHGEVNPTLA